MRHVSSAERRARLGRRHFLAEPGADPVAIAAAMVGLHSSDPATVYLSLQARAATARDQLDEALYEDRTLVRLLGMRRTMFVVDRELAGVMNSACTRDLVEGERRRLAKLVEDQGLADDGARWVSDVSAATVAAIDDRGEAVATDLRGDVPELTQRLRFGEGKKWGGEFGVSTRILFLLATQARIVRARPRGTWLSSQYRWAPTADWLGEPLPVIEREAARADLLRRWLRAFGPGTVTDLKWWTGWTVGDTRASLEACGAVEVTIDDTDGDPTGYLLPDDLASVDAPDDWAALLPGLDPTPMGWKQRNWYVGEHAALLFDRNGNIGPTVWCNGRIVGGWGQDSSGTVVVELLEGVTSADESRVEAKRVALQSWLGDFIVTPRFATPLHKEIATR